MEYRAHEIAETIIDRSRKGGISDLTNLKIAEAPLLFPGVAPGFGGCDFV